MLVSMVQPVIILSALFCVIWSFCMVVSETTGDQMVLAYSFVGKIKDLYVAIRVSHCFFLNNSTCTELYIASARTVVH